MTDLPNIVRAKPDNIPLVVPESMMIFCGHPDDELISAGGTILKYSELGTNITTVVATSGLGGYAKASEKKKIAEMRAKEFELVTKYLKCDFIEMKYEEITVTRPLISKFTNLIRKHQPQVILFPHPTDVHRTHRKLAKIVREAIYHTATGRAYGGFGKDFMPSAVYCYESPSCKFQYVDANVFITVDISQYWEKKQKIFQKIYASQIEVLDRVLEWAKDTATIRGNEINCDYGEAFIPLTEYVPLKILLG
ncbi:MAG: PIG-L family deacetylase [Candidatus Lokiarchaeota archaeon]|nr:PIG-L family deacetylase [Candidatus Lokiarchaeota archaeon]